MSPKNADRIAGFFTACFNWDLLASFLSSILPQFTGNFPEVSTEPHIGALESPEALGSALDLGHRHSLSSGHLAGRPGAASLYRQRQSKTPPGLSLRPSGPVTAGTLIQLNCSINDPSRQPYSFRLQCEWLLP